MTTSLATRADGRIPGRVGRQTRQKLMEAAIGQLAACNHRNVTVKDIAREVGTSPATFYQYFAGVEDIVLETAGSLTEETKTALTHFKDGSWSSDGLTGAAQLVDAVLNVWTQHRSVVRVLTAVAAEGDPRFVAAYAALTRPLTRALTTAVKRKVTSGSVRKALVYNLVGAVTAAAGYESAGSVAGLSEEQRRAGLVHVVHATVNGTMV
ncbi:TetR/AcrR family transcriptional regulator [Streptomyces chryseus]